MQWRGRGGRPNRIDMMPAIFTLGLFAVVVATFAMWGWWALLAVVGVIAMWIAWVSM